MKEPITTWASARNFNSLLSKCNTNFSRGLHFLIVIEIRFIDSLNYCTVAYPGYLYLLPSSGVVFFCRPFL